MEGEGTTKRWLERHKDLYRSATRHPFILSIQDGSIDLQAFKRWLGQDYFFVRAFVRFAASVLVKLPKDASEAEVDILLGGISTLEQEISWFRLQSSKWGVQFDKLTVQEANVRYCRFLDDLSEATVPLAVVLTAFWAIEVVYNESFATCLEAGAKTPAELIDACERWGNEGFKSYCTALQGLVDKYLQSNSVHVQEQAEEAFGKVLACEIEFWNMSIGKT